MSSIILYIKTQPKLKSFALWLITPKKRPRPRLWVRIFLTPLIHHRGTGSCIRGHARLDLFPYYKFSMGKNSTIEDFSVINNGAGNVIIGDNARIGIGSVIIGPVYIGKNTGIGQLVFVAGFNHGHEDASRDSNEQPLVLKPVILEDDVHLGSNVVVLPGVRIGTRSQVGAGSVVTKDIPPLCIAVGNPAIIVKKYNQEIGKWERAHPN